MSVKHIYAMDGDNSIQFADADSDLLNNVTGDLEVFKTRFNEVETDTFELDRLGVHIEPDIPILPPADEAIILDAWRNDRISSSASPVQVYVRANTCKDIVLYGHARGDETSFTFVPRMARDGSMVVEFMDPVMLDADAPRGDTMVIALPGPDPKTVRLILFTQTVVSHGSDRL